MKACPSVSDVGEAGGVEGSGKFAGRCGHTEA